VSHVRMPSASMAIALIALFVALGGTGYAASELTRSSGNPHDATAAATKKKKPRSVTTSTVNKLIAKFFANNQAKLTGATGATGTPGPTGSAGAQGPAGAAGANATRLFAQVSATSPPSTTRSSGVVSIEGPDDTGTPGFFIVKFDRDVSGCVAVGSRTSKDGNFPGVGIVSANHQGGDSIGVQTANNTGTPTTTDFSVAVFC
jgi:hypothetical protein